LKSPATAYTSEILVKLASVDFCVECGECEEKCPQKINIREELKKTHTLLTK
jgi:predicted aldo/keto reductase-like oxidoreductase